MAVMRPRQRARLAGIAGHAHVARVGEPPAVQRVLLHRGDEEAPVGRGGRRRDASPSIRAASARRRRWGTTATRHCNGRAPADSPWAGRRGRARCVGALQDFTAPGVVARARLLAGRPGDRAGRAAPARRSSGPFRRRSSRARRRRRSPTTRPSSPPVSSVLPSRRGDEDRAVGVGDDAPLARLADARRRRRRAPAPARRRERPRRRTCAPAASGRTCCGQRGRRSRP